MRARGYNKTKIRGLKLAGVLLCLMLLPAQAMAADFITTWQTDNPGDSNDNQITIPTDGVGYNYTVDWGDGNADVGVTGSITHTYAVPGTYQVSISGDFPKIFFDDVGDGPKLLSIDQWGDQVWVAMNRAFRGATNMVINATDTPDLSDVTNMNFMFDNTTFNDDIDEWDVSNVQLMGSVFRDNPNFNQDLCSWDTSSVTSMSSMFLGATAFNGDISCWNTANVTSMANMFHTASAFNQDIGGWDLGMVTTTATMFFRAAAFDQDIGAWDVSMVTSMQGMFQEAVSFNQDLSLWDTGNVVTMLNTFRGASTFNGDITTWDTQSVETMRGMLAQTDAFNQPIGNWNTSSVVDMSNMFQFAAVFDQDISGWDTSAVTSMPQMFQNAPAFNQNIGTWDTGMVENMRLMFDDATAFDGDIGAWDTSMVNDMSFMFRDADSFNQDIGAWDTSMVTTMLQMFFRADQFDQDLGSWDVTSLTDAANMFFNVTLSTPNYDSLLIGWDAQGLQNGVRFHGGDSLYCDGEAARTNMITADGWIITDDGLDCGNEAPTDIQIDNADTDSVIENAPSGTNIGVLTTTDPDAGDTHTYSISCAVAGADDALFQLSGNTLQSAAVFDFETPADANTDGVYEVCVRTTDDGTPSESYDEILQITIDNERPDLSITKQVDVDEPEVGQTVTFTLTVSNLSGDGATNLEVVDIVPAGFTYAGVISGGDTQDDSSPAGSGLEWTINNLQPGDPAVSLQFQALVNAP